jgi:serine protease Do
VSDVDAGSPADAAGVTRGDVITAVNGTAVKDSNVLRNEIAELQPGTAAKLTILRDGREQVLTAKLGELRSPNRRPGAKPRGERSERFGLTVEPLTPERARELGVSTRTGVVIVDVSPGSRAADAGLSAGDVVEQIDRKPVTSVDQLREVNTGSGPVLLLVHRGATTVFVTIGR